MKKAAWIISVICLLGTAFVLQFMPESVPMHYDAAGRIDRWGSKYEQLIVPIIIIGTTLFWSLFVHHYEKKASDAKDEKEKASALSNAKVLGVVEFANAAAFTILHGFLLYGAWDAANVNAQVMTIDVSKISGILSGAIMIILGNVMPKSRPNGTFGVRLAWSTYNENTWRKANRFGGYVFVIIGIIVIATALLVPGRHAAPFVLLGSLAVATVACLIYSRKVYLAEKEKNRKAEKE